MSDTVSITLPQSVPFPVTVSSIMCKKGDKITKHQTLFKYKYWDYQDDPNSKEDPPPKIRVEMIGTYESPIEGEVTDLKVGNNTEVAHSGVELCTIKEPCAHAVQYGGLCALCGKAIEDEKDYTGYNYEDRATIAMSHDNTGLRISYDEATKINQDTTNRLAKDQKLILVVDLDQTVIHATVDPTVGEWQLDPSNPNYKAVKDVQSFCLEEEQIPPPNWNGPKLSPTKCWYYVKLRPGLQEFLKNMSKIYEMHIYTMATRNYALAIANIIDPERIYFGDRILSRDESGSLTHKNLKRLFPVDQSMVVIIDDRGDVWQWESNLIKVVPYEFFVGIGDINSSFLPKKNGQLTGPTKKRKSLAKLEAFENNGSDSEDPERDSDHSDNMEESENESVDPKNSENGSENKEEQDHESIDDKEDKENIDRHSPVDRMLEIGGGEDNKKLLLEQSRSRTLSLEQQQHDRPLAKLQHDLEKINHDHESHSTHSSKSSSPVSDSDESSNGKDNENVQDDNEEDDSDDDDNLLFDDDNELQSLTKALTRIHEEYYKLLKSTEPNSMMKPDLTKVIPYLKSKCLDGIVILFSGIIPLGVNLDSADIVIWCKQFGVKVVNEVYPDVTHVVCRDPSKMGGFKTGLTFKVKAAKKLIPGVKIVNPDWLFACLSNWTKVDELDYLLEEPDEDWYVNEQDLVKYQKALENAKMNGETLVGRPRFDSITSVEEYDLDEANQEVDDFLADLSGDDDDDDDDDDGEDDGDGEDDSTRNKKIEGDDDDDDDDDREEDNKGTDSFIRDVYKKPNNKRRYEDEDSDQQDESNNRKKTKNNQDEEDLDELEQEILDGFEEIE